MEGFIALLRIIDGFNRGKQLSKFIGSLLHSLEGLQHLLFARVEELKLLLIERLKLGQVRRWRDFA